MPGPLKLTALLRPVAATPLETTAVLLALMKAPFALFLSFPRIIYQASVLHYKKRLDAFIRPEPYPASAEWKNETEPGHAINDTPLSGGIKWQGEGLLERFARKHVEMFLRARVEETRIRVILVPANPSTPRKTFSPRNFPDANQTNNESHEPSLTIYYLSPRLFTTLLLSPSAPHALLLGCTTERIFFPSSADLFVYVFSRPPEYHPRQSRKLNLGQRMRTRRIPTSLLASPDLPIPPIHPLDDIHTMAIGVITNIMVVWIILVIERIETWLFDTFNARLVPGQEPWRQWERAAAVHLRGRDVISSDMAGDVQTQIGSVRRE